MNALTFTVRHAGYLTGVRYDQAVKTFKSRPAATRFADAKNREPNHGGFFAVAETMGAPAPDTYVMERR